MDKAAWHSLRVHVVLVSVVSEASLVPGIWAPLLAQDILCWVLTASTSLSYKWPTLGALWLWFIQDIRMVHGWGIERGRGSHSFLPFFMGSDHTYRGQATPRVASSSFPIRYWVYHTWAVRHGQWRTWPFVFFLLLVTIRLKLDSTCLRVFWTGLISGESNSQFLKFLKTLAERGHPRKLWLRQGSQVSAGSKRKGRAQSALRLPSRLQGYSPALLYKCPVQYASLAGVCSSKVTELCRRQN